MSLEEKVHNAQIKILRELLFLPAAHFAALQRATGLDSDHVKFHIKRLVALGYVTKTADGYMYGETKTLEAASNASEFEGNLPDVPGKEL